MKLRSRDVDKSAEVTQQVDGIKLSISFLDLRKKLLHPIRWELKSHLALGYRTGQSGDMVCMPRSAQP